jgi:hypothetical protein
MLVTGPHLIGIGTARNMTVPVTIRICETRLVKLPPTPLHSTPG